MPRRPGRTQQRLDGCSSARTAAAAPAAPAGSYDAQKQQRQQQQRRRRRQRQLRPRRPPSATPRTTSVCTGRKSGSDSTAQSAGCAPPVATMSPAGLTLTEWMPGGRAARGGRTQQGSIACVSRHAGRRRLPASPHPSHRAAARQAARAPQEPQSVSVTGCSRAGAGGSGTSRRPPVSTSHCTRRLHLVPTSRCRSSCQAAANACGRRRWGRWGVASGSFVQGRRARPDAVQRSAARQDAEVVPGRMGEGRLDLGWPARPGVPAGDVSAPWARAAGAAGGSGGGRTLSSEPSAFWARCVTSSSCQRAGWADRKCAWASVCNLRRSGARAGAR